MGRTKEGGSVLGFVVIGIIMAALLVGGVYAIRQLTAQPEPTAGPQEPAPTPSEPDQSEKQNKQNENKSEKQQSSDNKQTTQPEATKPSSGSDQAKELPQTGPHETLLAAVMLATLSIVAVSYVRSRRPGLSL